MGNADAQESQSSLILQLLAYDGALRARRIVTTPNIIKSATRFEIDSKAFYDASMAADRDGLAFLGFFHSHPAPAEPSSVDLAFMRLWGEAVWIVFSLTENKLAAFKMRKGKACAVTLKIEGKD